MQMGRELTPNHTVDFTTGRKIKQCSTTGTCISRRVPASNWLNRASGRLGLAGLCMSHTHTRTHATISSSQHLQAAPSLAWLGLVHVTRVLQLNTFSWRITPQTDRFRVEEEDRNRSVWTSE